MKYMYKIINKDTGATVCDQRMTVMLFYGFGRAKEFIQERRLNEDVYMIAPARHAFASDVKEDLNGKMH